MIVSGRRFAQAVLSAASVIAAALGAPAATPPEVHGDLVVEYRDPEFAHPSFNDAAQPDDFTGVATWRLLQADVALDGRVGEHSRYYVRTTLSSRSTTLTEAWIANDALGPGTLTFGRFYRPRGAPIPLFNLSIPALVLHVYQVEGLKYAGEVDRTRWRYEVGLARTNPILLGASIGDAPIIGRPVESDGATFSDGPAEGYLHLGKVWAGEWGSLDVGATLLYGRLMESDATTLANSGLFTRTSLDRVRRGLDVAADYAYGPFAAYAEVVALEEGIFKHVGWEAGLRQRIRRDLSVVAAYGEYRAATDLTGFEAPAAWDRSRTTLAASWDVRPGLQVLGGYEWNEEDVLGAMGVIPNDAFTVQVLTYW